MEIKEKTTLEAWKKALNHVLIDGTDFKDVDKRTCREAFNLQITITSPADDISKPIEKIASIGKWVYPPLDEIANIVLVRKIAPVYTYAYGPRIFNFQEAVDQINNFVIPLLKKDPTSRRAVVTIWDPKTDSNIYKKEVPGRLLLDFKLRNGKLHVTSVIRSNDMFFGWPANIYQLYILQDYVAKKLDVELGSLNTFSTSAHIFSDNFSYVKDIIND